MAKRGSKSRKLSSQEQLLWQKVTKDVVGKPAAHMPDILPNLTAKKPTIRKNLKASAAPLASNLAQANPLDKGYLAKLMQRFDGNNHAAHDSHSSLKNNTGHNVPQYSHEQPENQPLERKVRQKLQRGRADVDARLDLHGYNRNNAYAKLMSFLRGAWQQGFKTVIVVTGKGDGAIARHSLHSADFFSMPEQRAVLRASIGDWLNSDEAAQFVIGWQPAHPKHGGGGAVYVRIKNRKY